MLQEHFQHILQFEDNFEDNNFQNDIKAHPEEPQPIFNLPEGQHQLEHQPEQVPPIVELPIPATAKRGKPPKPKEQDPEYRPRQANVINTIAKRTRARQPDKFMYEPFIVLETFCTIVTCTDQPSEKCRNKTNL